MVSSFINIRNDPLRVPGLNLGGLEISSQEYRGFAGLLGLLPFLPSDAPWIQTTMCSSSLHSFRFMRLECQRVPVASSYEIDIDSLVPEILFLRDGHTIVLTEFDISKRVFHPDLEQVAAIRNSQEFFSSSI
jgi:hypothetical protein